MPNFWHRASFTLAETTSSLGTPKILSTGATLETFRFEDEDDYEYEI